jgi:hypothetical protein
MVEEIRAKGWRQGSIFSPQTHKALAEFAPTVLQPTDCCIVVTQSCDIVCPDFDAEPVAEVVLARKLDSPTDRNFTHARSARRLHLQVEITGTERGYEAQIKERFNVPRRLLAAHNPDPDRKVRDTDYNDLITWLVARYDRHAFPDAFNERIRAATELKIKPILKKLPKIKALYMALKTWDELPEETAYRLELLITLNAEDFEVIQTRQAVEKGAMGIAAALSECPGIEVDDARVFSEKEVTLDMLRYVGRWNFDYMSLKNPSVHIQPGTTHAKARS